MNNQTILTVDSLFKTLIITSIKNYKFAASFRGIS